MKLRSGIKEKTFQLDIKREWKSERKKSNWIKSSAKNADDKANSGSETKKNLLESYDNKWDKVERNLKRQKTLGDQK